jgi:hypothetical protein
MNNRSKILTFGLIVLIIFTGVIYAQNQKSAEETGDKFEITENNEELKSEVTDKKETPEQEDLEQDFKIESDVESAPEVEDKIETASPLAEENQDNKIESNTEDSDADTADGNAGMIKFEELISSHPETQKIYQEYKTEKEQLEDGENKAENLAKLKDTYTSLVLKKTGSDLKEFAEAKNLNLLVVNNQIVVGEKDKEEKLPELKDQSQEFKDFLNK